MFDKMVTSAHVAIEKKDKFGVSIGREALLSYVTIEMVSIMICDDNNNNGSSAHRIQLQKENIVSALQNDFILVHQMNDEISEKASILCKLDDREKTFQNENGETSGVPGIRRTIIIRENNMVSEGVGIVNNHKMNLFQCNWFECVICSRVMPVLEKKKQEKK